MNIDELVAIDIHTHAEEPCDACRDDGYNEFQTGMANYFKNPAGAEGMLPSIQETAAYFRERKIAAVIFPVDAERETGFRRYHNEEVLEIAKDNDDILIPFASIDPHKGK
ncbi:MAG: 4-hydroxyphenyl-beta-ketoacyl-CoA hydrolase, partial [Rhodobacteraceae bacterium]|nr:4-hydroxyphenyl-beta-ketoacyl-CoA hydrolase [Paracoccaceae bacterium]